MNELEHTLLNILAKHDMKLSDLVERAGYNPTFFGDVVSGKNRKMPVNFFIRIAPLSPNLIA